MEQVSEFDADFSDLLEDDESREKKPIVFATAIFHQQFAAQARHVAFKTEITDIKFKRVCYVVAEGSILRGKRVTQHVGRIPRSGQLDPSPEWAPSLEILREQQQRNKQDTGRRFAIRN